METIGGASPESALLARAMVRHRELTIRAALGAGTGRLARQLLIENAIVGVLGSVAGLALTMALHAALPSLARQRGTASLRRLAIHAPRTRQPHTYARETPLALTTR